MTLEDKIMNLVRTQGRKRSIIVIVGTEDGEGYSCAINAETPEEAVGLCNAAITYTSQVLDVDPANICKAVLSVLKSQLPVSSQEIN